MRCPKAERWAELDRLLEDEREAMLAHAAGCLACGARRARVAAVRGTLSDIARTPAPELSWDLLGARLHWNVSSELKRRERAAEGRAGRVRALMRRWGWVLVGSAATAGALAAVLALRHPAPGPSPVPTLVAAGQPDTPAAAVAPREAAAGIEALATLVQGEVTLDGAALYVESAVRAGMTIRTGAGRVALQFGDRSAFVVEPQTELALVSLAEDTVELRVVRGRVGVDLAHRRPSQRFAVLAGARRVEVRGTAFRVAREEDDALEVTVVRGKVAVLEGTDQVDVPAGARLAVRAGAHLAGLFPQPIGDREAKALAAAVRVPLVPSFAGVPEARARSAILQVAAGPRARVRIDGVDVGVGTLSVRAPAGRYLVEVGSASQWVDLEAGTVAATRVEEVAPRSERPAQLDQELGRHKAELGQCAPYKQDLDFHAELEVELRVGRDGAVNYVTLVKGSGYRDVETCVLERIRSSFTFPAGTATTVRKKIRL